MDEKQKLNIDCSHLSDTAEDCDGPAISPSKDKRKKKKKKSKSSLSKPSHIYAFDEAKQQRLAEERMSNVERKPKHLEKCSTFPSSDPRPIPLAKSLEYEDAHRFNNASPTSTKFLSSSCPSSFLLKSALRGGYEGLGLGPRPKLHVKWAVDVNDPPATSMSHTVTRHSNSKKKKDKKHHHKSRKSKSEKSKNKAASFKQQSVEGLCTHFSALLGCQEKPGVPDCAGVEADERVVSSDENTCSAETAVASYVYVPSSEKNGKHLRHSQNENNSTWFSSKSFFASMEVAMQHMLQASKSIETNNVADALAEYKAAAHIFRLAKLDAGTENIDNHDCEVAVKQAIRGQVLAWIAMATLYSARGQISKGQKCHNLALQACQDAGLSLANGVNSMENFESFSGNRYKGSNCSLAALASSGCDNVRTEIS